MHLSEMAGAFIFEKGGTMSKIKTRETEKDIKALDKASWKTSKTVESTPSKVTPVIPAGSVVIHWDTTKFSDTESRYVK